MENQASPTPAPSATATAIDPSPAGAAETPPAVAAEALPIAGPVLCPKCHNKLVDAVGLGWCAKCGYCRSLEEDSAKLAVRPVARKTSTGGAGDLVRLVRHVPPWAWLLLGGMALFAAASLLPGRYLAPNSFERAVWCTAQIAVGLVLILAAQFWALLRLAHE